MGKAIVNPKICFPLKKLQKLEGVSMALNILDTFTLIEFMLTTRGLKKFKKDTSLNFFSL